MRIAILSDVHDHLENLRQALGQVQGCGALLFCGDLCAPFSLREIIERFPGPIHAVRGNNDGDMLFLLRVAQEAGRVTMHGDYGEVELAGRKIALVHYPRLAEGLAATGDYDLVCHGHDHVARSLQVGRTLLLNPGEVMGWKGRPSCAIYDSETGQAEVREIR
jgi:putative phosphoesterase